jgi:seryl-tRNA synthetase
VIDKEFIDDQLPNGGGFLVGEITSTLNCTDYQSRRLNIKYQLKDTSKTEYVYMLNGTAFAVSRTLLLILENYQQEDGSISLPKVLQPYLGFDVIKWKS